jgi:hypothetical protein
VRLSFGASLVVLTMVYASSAGATTWNNGDAVTFEPGK